MAIIRSKIARQLLAEGGAPRKGFMFGSPGSAEQEASFGAQAAMNQDDYESLDQEGQAEVDQARFDAGIRSADFGNLNVNEGSDTPSFFQKSIDALGTGLQNRRGQSIINFLNRSTAPTMRGKLGLGKSGDINYVLDLLQNPDDRVYGLSNKEREIGEKLISAGIRDEFDIRNMTQSQFNTLFPGPPTGGGGDNEPIKKLRAPITEAKKEEPKDEFADILKFYGARFAEGGTTGDSYGEDVGAAYGTAGLTDASDSGDNGDGGGPPTVMGGGTEPRSQKGLQGLRNQGFSDSKIAELLGPLAAAYGLEQQTPTVAGPLGSGLGALTPTAPAPAMGQVQGITNLGTTGTKGTKGTGFTIDDIADKVFDTGSLGGIARDALRSNKEAIEAAAKENLGLKDGGEVRQNYGLGSIVKKAVGAVKKVAKSPIGKAALFAAPFIKFPGMESSLFAKAFPNMASDNILKSIFMKDDKLNPFTAITAASLLAGSLAKEDEEDEKLPTVANTDPEMTKFIDFYGGPRRFAEDGGDIEDAPMKTASMPSSFGELNQLSIDLFGRPYDQLNDSEQEILIEYFTKGKKQGIERATAAMGGMMEKDEMLDLGGKEMDLRGGGFVPLGEYEKKDDVPARLSKNEFVFTADAVRAAGGGSVDKGADVMYKTMKTLENKVA